LRGKRDETPQFPESLHALAEVVKNGDFVLSADDLEGGINGG
jgi:hypothetical protein